MTFSLFSVYESIRKVCNLCQNVTPWWSFPNTLWCCDFLVVCNYETSLISDLSLISSLFVLYVPALPVINSAFLSIWKANKCAYIPCNFSFCPQMSRLLCWLNHIAMIKDTIKEFIKVLSGIRLFIWILNALISWYWKSEKSVKHKFFSSLK